MLALEQLIEPDLPERGSALLHGLAGDRVGKHVESIRSFELQSAGSGK